MRFYKPLVVLTVIYFMIASRLFATGDSLYYLLPKDSIILTIDNDGEKIFNHKIEKKQTLYSLAYFYGLSVEELYYYNPGLKEATVKIHQGIRVPIPNRAITRYLPQDETAIGYIPVYYVVKKGDTMYRISQQFFRLPIDVLMERNHLTNNQLKTGQLLHVGWMNMGGIPEDYRQITGGPMARRNFAMKKVYLRESNGKKEHTEQGVAFWQKNSKEESDFYALHRTAPVNSVIAVENPMTKRTVYVKVIGDIPDAAFGYDVVVVLSPLMAKLLGAKDPRFFVHVNYHK
ncbi:MAG: LysM peptidoglycan-binding domain-containing protein [Saprospiraceae bacterium]|nr:LysM peptidoglycan-binding domain-containing protein [Saprospiraceae bacterium]MCB9325546.1 LysM peptidoglycan-binding domain-containing protein [Lewinellaceae bacterium]